MTEKKYTRHQLYRYYDKDYNLLYVGISLSAVGRLAQHKITDHWYDLVATIEIDNLSSREELLEAEKRVIEYAKPPFNKLHNEHFKEAMFRMKPSKWRKDTPMPCLEDLRDEFKDSENFRFEEDRDGNVAILASPLAIAHMKHLLDSANNQ